MTKNEAIELLKTAPRNSTPSRLNPVLSQAQAVEIVEKGIVALKTDVLPDYI